ncbi:ATP-binding protein [Cryptosporangium arvum]|uniref:Uncharacterized protein n=1 Tax=Cryptosporangium arvum DSM 44712 TaxID=927661 RepID=A0A010ZXQ3_9ACTN|nr:ATP-binding protein [Cryptosporangium arvum]EXG82002.1 hypothetical protein CryarDRAFT_3132 [Cryptosporangium arvum DSM 44712]
MTDLFAEGVVSQYVRDDPDFVPRPWFADRFEAALQDPNCRYLLLVGEPGAGKTAALAWLADHDRQSLRYFVRRDSRQPLSAGDAQSFLLALGHQLASRRPSLFRPDRLRIAVRQRIDALRAGARAVGIDVEELVLSPFYQTAIQVEQDVRIAAGEVIGVRAGRAVLEDRLLSPESLQYLALLDPAAVLAAEDPAARIVIFVDSLDELRYHLGGPTILSWLENAPQLPANILVVLASRPDDSLLGVFRDRQRQWLQEHHVGADLGVVNQDALQFARRRVANPIIRRAVSRAGADENAFVARTVDLAAGNFQYLSALYRGIQASEQASLDELPEDLTGLYRFFVDQVAGAMRDQWVELPSGDLAQPAHRMPAWEGSVEPLLTLLAAAFAPVTRSQLERFLPDRPLVSGLRVIRQFVREHDGGYSVYHDTFRDYLHERLNVTDGHRRIASSYRAGQATWSDVEWSDADEYAMSYLAQHVSALVAAGAVSLRELDDLISRPLMLEKSRRYGSLESFAVDVRLAVDTASRISGTGALVAEVRARWLLANLAAAALSVPEDLIAAAGRAGASRLAIGLAESVRDPSGRAVAFLAAGMELVRAGEHAIGCGALRTSLAVMDAAGFFPIPAISRMLGGFAQAADRAGVDLVVEFIDRADPVQPSPEQGLLADVIDAYAVLGDSVTCSDRATRLMFSDTAALTTVCRALAKVGDHELAMRLAERSTARVAVGSEVAEQMVLEGSIADGAELGRV